MIAAMSAPAAAEVLDAVYRGTLVCEKLPFTRTQMREAIDVTIIGGVARYNHVVRLRDKASEVLEKGAGVVKGQNIELQGIVEGRHPPIRGEIQRHLRAAQRPAQGHAELDRWRQDRHPRLLGRDQAAAEAIPAAQASLRRDAPSAVYRGWKPNS